ncbi:hypothetical protein Drorol1_Dr00015373 [Drosera rotundifolia]
MIIRLESMIAKRRARKMLSMQPRRSRRNDFHGYVYHDQTLVPLIVPARAVEDDGQPGSAPSMMLPKRNPFDLPYDPSEEKPNLTWGSFMEVLFNAHQKEISFCRHESFVRGPGFMDDFGGGGGGDDDDPIANSLPSFFPKLRTLGAPGFSRCRHPSDMEENELGGFSSQEGQVAEMQNDSHEQADEPSPENEDLGNSADKEFPFQGVPFLRVEAAESVPDQADEPSLENEARRNSTVLQVETAESVPDQLGKTEADLVGTKESEDVETKEGEDIETKDGEKDSSIDMEERAVSADEAGDEGSSSSSSEASEDVINAVKNEAFQNSVKKVLNCLIPRKKSYGFMYNCCYPWRPTSL